MSQEFRFRRPDTLVQHHIDQQREHPNDARLLHKIWIDRYKRLGDLVGIPRIYVPPVEFTAQHLLSLDQDLKDPRIVRYASPQIYRKDVLEAMIEVSGLQFDTHSSELIDAEHHRITGWYDTEKAIETPHLRITKEKIQQLERQQKHPFNFPLLMLEYITVLEETGRPIDSFTGEDPLRYDFLVGTTLNEHGFRDREHPLVGFQVREPVGVHSEGVSFDRIALDEVDAFVGVPDMEVGLRTARLSMDRNRDTFYESAGAVQEEQEALVDMVAKREYALSGTKRELGGN